MRPLSFTSFVCLGSVIDTKFYYWREVHAGGLHHLERRTTKENSGGGFRRIEPHCLAVESFELVEMALRKVEIESDNVKMDEELIKLAAGQFDVALVRHLSLRSFGIATIGGLTGCDSLVELDLAFNRITSLQSLLPVAGTLQRLHLQFNKLEKIAELQAMMQLEVLHLEGNMIATLADLDPIASVPSLRSLHLREKNGASSNPVCATECYAKRIVGKFSRARCIDGHYFLKEEANPMRLDAGGDDEIVLPESKPWVNETFFERVLWDGDKAGAAVEKIFRGALTECDAALEKSVKGK